MNGLSAVCGRSSLALNVDPNLPASSVQRGGVIHITAASSFASALSKALERINQLITSKLADFFELSEYDWTPKTREDAPSLYLYELVHWLTPVIDSLPIKDTYKEDAYRAAVAYVAQCLMVGMKQAF